MAYSDWKIGAIKFTSARFGPLVFTFPIFSSFNTTPSNEFDDVEEMLEDYFLPWLHTMFLHHGNSTSVPSAYQYFTYFTEQGFTDVSPYVTGVESNEYSNDIGWFINSPYREQGKSYYDIWTLSTGDVYYVFSGSTSITDEVYLNKDENNASSTRIRFIHNPDSRQHYGVSILSYNPELNPNVLSCIIYNQRYNGSYFTVVGNNGTVPYTINATQAEIDFYSTAPIFVPDPLGPPTDQDPGGDGPRDDESDEIDFPDLPTIGATNAGMVTLFNPTLSDLIALNNFLWSSFDINSFKRIFADPMDCIIGLYILPFAISSSGTKALSVGNVPTGLTFQVASTQFIEVDCGSVIIPEYWHAYLDYSPYTKIQLYLPYIGVEEISADDVMGQTVSLKYHIDILTGSCVAMLKSKGSILYTFMGHCSVQIPITSNNMDEIMAYASRLAVTAAAGSIGAAASSGVDTSPAAMGDTSYKANKKFEASEKLSGISDAQHSATSGVSNVMGMKFSARRTGAIGSFGGFLAPQKPYFIITRPNLCLAEDQGWYAGYPAWKTKKMGTIAGYARIDSVHLENIPCTENELHEIESLLKGGVIL